MTDQSTNTAQGARPAGHNGHQAPYNEVQVLQAAKLYEMREQARHILGDAYKVRMATIGAMLTNVAAARGKGAIEAAIAVCQHNAYGGIELLLVMAAAVELVEPTP